MVVDVDGGKSSGFIKTGSGEAYSLDQRGGASLQAPPSVKPAKQPAWECGTDSLPNGGRALLAGEHEHGYEDGHEHEHDLSIDGLLETAKRLRGGGLDRKLQTSGLTGRKVARLYLEYDQALADILTTDLHPSLDGSNLAAARQSVLEYISYLLGVVNVVYSAELGLSFEAARVQLTDIYDKAANTNRALNIMRSTWSGSNFGGGETIALHHGTRPDWLVPFPAALLVA